MRYKIRIDGQDFNVEVGDISSHPIRVNVDGEMFEVWPETTLPEQKPAKSIVAPAVSAKPLPSPTNPPPEAPAEDDKTPSLDRNKAIQAPIPGIIIKISVKAGEEVEYGQELCVLEAMKMNNLIRAPQPGIIAAIHVSEGKQVKHGDLLMEFA